jgi:hypothetical protein
MMLADVIQIIFSQAAVIQRCFVVHAVILPDIQTAFQAQEFSTIFR